MESEDIAKMIFAAAHLSPQAVVEDIVMRPQKGDLLLLFYFLYFNSDSYL